MEIFRAANGNYCKVEKWAVCPFGHKYINEYRIWKDTNVFSSRKVCYECSFCRVERKRKDRLKRAGIPFRYWDKTVQSFDLSLIEPRKDSSGEVSSRKSNRLSYPEEVRAMAAKVKGVCSSYIEAMEENMRDGKSLLFMGWAGTGKTHLACGIAIEALERGFSVLYSLVTNYLQFGEDIYATKYQLAQSVVRDSQNYDDCDLLVLDKVDSGLSLHERRRLRALLDKRYNAKKATFLLTTLTIAQLEVLLGQDCIDYFRESTNPVLAFIWESNRKRVSSLEPNSAIEKPRAVELFETWTTPDDDVHPSHKEADESQNLTLGK